MSVVNNNLLLTADAATSAYQISRSLRFNSADSAYANRTFGTPTTQGTFTLAMWVKRAALGTAQSLFGVSTNHSFGFTTGNALNLTFGGTSALTTTAVFRDTSAWYHIVWTQSGTSHTVYVNGTSQGTATATSSVFNTAVAHQVAASNTTNYFNGYLADVHFIDGQALTPSSFTETNATTGQLVPKAYTGTHGTNGFRLNFSDNSAATAATLGADSSGNGNNWTPNNLSVTAGVGNDSLTDTPTSYGTNTGAGGEVRGNYATLNPLDNTATLSNGNLDVTWPSHSYASSYGTIAIPSTGSWYYECNVTSTPSAGDLWFGISLSAGVGALFNTTASFVLYRYEPKKGIDNVYTAYGNAFTLGDVIGVAINVNGGQITFYKNGVSQGAISYSLTGKIMFPCFALYAASASVNFGQRPFAYAAPSGFKALCDTNIPEGSITTSGTFTGNANANGPFVYLNGVPTAMTINSNAVTFATHVDKLANGFKVRSSSGSYNTAGSNTYSITTTGAKFKYARAQANP